MGFFKNKKGSLISDHFKLLEKVATFQKGICMKWHYLMII